MLYMALCGEYVLFEKFGFSGCCGGRESLSGTITSGVMVMDDASGQALHDRPRLGLRLAWLDTQLTPY